MERDGLPAGGIDINRPVGRQRSPACTNIRGSAVIRAGTQRQSPGTTRGGQAAL